MILVYKSYLFLCQERYTVRLGPPHSSPPPPPPPLPPPLPLPLLLLLLLLSKAWGASEATLTKSRVSICTCTLEGCRCFVCAALHGAAQAQSDPLYRERIFFNPPPPPPFSFPGSKNSGVGASAPRMGRARERRWCFAPGGAC